MWRSAREPRARRREAVRVRRQHQAHALAVAPSRRAQASAAPAQRAFLATLLLCEPAEEAAAVEARIREATRLVMALADAANEYVEQKAPWTLKKDPARLDARRRAASRRT